MDLSKYKQGKGRVITTKNETFTSKTTSKKPAKKALSKEKKNKKKNSVHFFAFFKNEKMIVVYGILLITFALLLLVSIFSSYFHFLADSSCLESKNGEIQNIIGKIGAILSYYTVKYTFGIFSIGFPFLLFLYGLKIAFKAAPLNLIKISLTVITSMAWLSLFFGYIFAKSQYNFISGIFGVEISQWLNNYLGNWGTILVIFVLLIIILILFYNLSFVSLIEKLNHIDISKTEQSGDDITATQNSSVSNSERGDGEGFSDLYIAERNGLSREYDKNIIDLTGEENGNSPLPPRQPQNNAPEEDNIELEIVNSKDLPKTELFENEDNQEDCSDDSTEPTSTPIEPIEDYDPRADLSFYKFPTTDLLEDYEGKEDSSMTAGDMGGLLEKEKEKELMENKNKIVTTLKNFGIPIKRITAMRGPTVTLYEIVPADGVRISKIKNLEDDIALNLSALGIRIIAPMPGKGTIGIEVPNKTAQIVSMKRIIASDRFQNNKYDLPIGIGRTISGEPFVVDLAKMPHLLMAGATGQGKSVGLNAIITSLLYRKHPSELKFVLVDPKKVEFTLYSAIEKHYLAKLPHAEEPIITDTKKVVETLNSLCVEMDSRYDLLKIAKTRNIKEYNAKFCTRKLSPAFGHRYLPYIVLIIDEFGDLLMTAGKEVETPIARLAQLARAVGIHLIIATQRPSVNIITGTIKANFPARLAFRVTSVVDSRTILDSKGANQLIGRGDMLLDTGSDLIRLQCAFVDTPEVERICNYIEDQQSYPEAFMLPEYIIEDKKTTIDEENMINSDSIDPSFMEAAQLIVETQMGSTSLIQRKLKLGYNRAGRIMDQLEEFNIVGPSAGSKAREVKVKSMEELNQILKQLGFFA